MSYVGRWVRTGIALAIVSVLGWLGGCSESPVGPACCDPPEGLVVSDPSLVTSLAAVTGALAITSGPGDSVVYVSLPPGTVPTGSRAVVRRVGDSARLITSVLNGGFDPVLVGADVGDSIEVLVTDAGGNPVPGGVFGMAVTAARPPIVVRTDPPRRKTDVPVNASIVIVFSEPVAEEALTPGSVQLFRGTSTVAGAITLLQGTGALAAFVPTAPLAANTEYRLEVTQAVRDLDGDALQGGVTVTFTTGQSSTGPAASLDLSPDTVYMSGTTYQMSATVRDAAGNELIGLPITWSTSDPNGLTVSPTGLLTALAAGEYSVNARVGSVQAFASVNVSAGPPASVTVSPAQASVGAAGDTINLVATVRDASGRLLDHPSVVWTSSDAAVATVAGDSSGNAGRAFATVTGVSPGGVTITATSGTASGTASVTVIPPLPVASVTVTPASLALVVRATRQLSATLRDANGKVLAGRFVTWTTDNGAVVTVDASGLITAVGAGSSGVAATSEGISDTAAITVTAITFGSVSAGFGRHACGLTASGAAYCWGIDGYGELGDGTISPEMCQTFEPCSTAPVAVVGGLTFTSLSAGGGLTCGVTTSGAAYCWGSGGWGALGNGSTIDRLAPVAVTGGLTFSALRAGSYHTCGLTTTGAAYCWGHNGSGQLGASTAQCTETGTPCSTTPVAVTGGLTFSMLSVGGHHTCGLTANGAAYCWGDNFVGELGDGTTISRSVPVAVSGGLTFSSLSVGFEHSCGVTTSGAAYCWGNNATGELGDPSLPRTNEGSRSLVPVAVTGGLTFSAVSGGGFHTCGVTISGAAYCWGENSKGQLGTGLTDWSLVPVPVTGGLTFSSVIAGERVTCGLAASGAAYCWGWNEYGQLGNGTTTDSNVPVRVAGQP